MNFRKSFCTNTRLMGTMMLMIEWSLEGKIVSHVFMLDAEGLGISDFYTMIDESMHNRECFYRQKYGGLGGVNVDISEEEACFLVNQYMDKNIRYEKALPESFNIDIREFYRGKYEEIGLPQIEKLDGENPSLEENENLTYYNTMKKNVFRKICKNIETENEFVNYMIMRLVARDREVLLYFSGNEYVAETHLTKINGALLYNEIEKKAEDRFVCNCVYEDSDGYYEAKVIVTIHKEEIEDDGTLKLEGAHYNYSLRTFMIVSVNAIYDFEVFDIISKEETVDIYNLTEENSRKKIENIIYNAYPAIQGIEFDDGVLYIQYYPDNAHVDGDIYVINNDIMFIIYINEKQIFLATYNEEARELIEESLRSQMQDRIEKKDTMSFRQNVLFDFVESGNDDFYDFLN